MRRSPSARNGGGNGERRFAFAFCGWPNTAVGTMSHGHALASLEGSTVHLDSTSAPGPV